MNKALFTLAILVMAFGNVSFAQSKANLESKATATVLQHYGVRDATTMVPQTATWRSVLGDQYRTTYNYDEYDYYLIEALTEVKTDDNWLNFIQLTYEYDFDGNVLEMLLRSYVNGTWMNEDKASYTYEDAMLREIIIQEYVDGTWINEIKEDYTYLGNVTTVLYWSWNGNNWTTEELYTYTKEGNSIELIIQYMQGGAWQNDEKQVFTLDFDERIVEIMEQDWVNNTWVNEEQTVYNYEGAVFTSKFVNEWNGSAWADHYRYVYEYDDKGNAIQGECFGMVNNEWNYADGDIEMAYGYSEVSNEYFGSHVDVEYVDLTVVDDNATVNFKAYPVPAENELIIQVEGFQKAEIYSVTGQKLIESSRSRMDVGTLGRGVYLLKVYDQAGVAGAQRIVVK